MLLIFDGDCGFCTTSARWIQRRLPDTVDVSPWQGLTLANFALSEHEVRTAAYWIDAEGRAHRGHLAVGHALIATGGIWAAIGHAIIRPPLRWLAAPVYRLVAKYRHRLPGSTDACRIGR